MIHFVPTVVFDFPFTVNKLPLELHLVRALLPQVHLAPLSPSRAERAAVIASGSPERRTANVDPTVALRYE
jgi:hypothetical protein